ncbi:MAG: adenylosuccinate lyase [Helicobacter sp.]|nr:adenylosuccinate lyase [Helicobacter sp.]
MIERYAREKMLNLWSEQSKVTFWLEVEKAVILAHAKLNNISQKSAEIIAKNARFDLKRMQEIEQKTKHDFIAFVENVLENLSSDQSDLDQEEIALFHHGLTSSDCIDTALNLQLKRALDLIKESLGELLLALKEQAFIHKFTPMIGRSHGIAGEPITFGIKCALFYDEIRRHLIFIKELKNDISKGGIAGAMGNFAHICPDLEKYTCEFLGLDPISKTQVISRDLHAKVICALGLIASSCEKIAIEIRALQRSEIGEVREFFDIEQKGSSAMPHKRNPILSENITGLCRVVRAFVTPALENVALWHERDMSHSSVERFMFRDCFVTLDFLLHRLSGVIKELQINPKNMLRNIYASGGLIFSQKILLELCNIMPRAEAYKVVQNNAKKVWTLLENGQNLNWDEFYNALCQDSAVCAAIDPQKLKSYFEIDAFLKHTDFIFARIFDH